MRHIHSYICAFVYRYFIRILTYIGYSCNMHFDFITRRLLPKLDIKKRIMQKFSPSKCNELQKGPCAFCFSLPQ